jgi:hypothetical protein
VLHFVGTSLFIAQAAAAAHARNPKLLLSGIISAYGCAWLGHFFVEKNRPATFKYPLMSLIRCAVQALVAVLLSLMTCCLVGFLQRLCRKHRCCCCCRCCVYAAWWQIAA